MSAYVCCQIFHNICIMFSVKGFITCCYILSRVVWFMYIYYYYN